MPHTLDYPEAITCIDTEQLRPGLACCYLVRGGGEYAFIECGTGLSVPGLLRVFDARAIRREHVRYVMPTHVHLDHAGGAGLLMRALPEARLVVHPRAARHLIDPAKLIDGAAAVYGAQNIARLYGEILPVPEARMVIAEEGFKLSLGGRELWFMDAPGHARHHYAIWDAQSSAWFSGDVFGISYREFDGPLGPHLLPTTTPVQFEPEVWLQTLDRIMARQPLHAFLTHYGRVSNLQSLVEILRRGITDYADIARRQAASPARHAAIKSALADWSLRELAQLRCALSEQRSRELLENDMELNAQGLEVWLDRAGK